MVYFYSFVFFNAIYYLEVTFASIVKVTKYWTNEMILIDWFFISEGLDAGSSKSVVNKILGN